MRTRHRFFLLAAAFAIPAAAVAQQTPPGVRLGLTYGTGARPGLVVLPSAGADGDSIRAILQRDLDFDDRAAVIAVDDRTAHALLPAAGDAFNYPLFAQLGIAGIILPEVSAASLNVKMFDVATRRLVQASSFPLAGRARSASWRQSLHAVSDEIGNWIFGSRGAAESRILFTGGDGQIWIIDSDGANQRRLTAVQLAMSPSWNADGSRFAFSGASEGSWRIGVYDFATDRISWATSGRPGTIAITPAFSPDGGSIAYAYGDERGTNLWLLDLSGGAPRRLNVTSGSDNAAPSFSPDGRRIAFVSGRAGHPEIYTMDADGSGAELLTEFNFGERNYRASPDWSPDGHNIAYQSQLGGEFEIMSMVVRDRTTKQLTREANNEDPSWGPDGRHIVFSSNRSGAQQLWVVDLESGRLRQLTIGGRARLPAWSHFLTH